MDAKPFELQKKVGIVDDERCEYHSQGDTHQESPARLQTIRKKLKQAGLYKKLAKIKPEEPEREDLLTVHSNKYTNKVFRTCNNYKNTYIDTPDVNINGVNSLISSMIAVGSVLSAVNTVMTTNIKKVFCNVRPPGHHATRYQASGFCIFNNVAIGVKKALSYPLIKRVLIFDFDLHHGDGTESIFKCDENVMYCSFHRAAPFYPNSGHSYFTGKYGNILNFPQESTDTVEKYLDEFYNIFIPDAKRFRPDIIFISAGFDSHKDDIYHALPLDYEHFKTITKELCILANLLCGGRIISVLEGGYDPEVLGKCVVDHIGTLIENNTTKSGFDV